MLRIRMWFIGFSFTIFNSNIILEYWPKKMLVDQSRPSIPFGIFGGNRHVSKRDSREEVSPRAFALGRMRAKGWLEKNGGREWRGKESWLYRTATERQYAVVKREIWLVGVLIFLGSCHVQRRGGPTLERLRDSSFETATRRDATAAATAAAATVA